LPTEVAGEDEGEEGEEEEDAGDVEEPVVVQVMMERGAGWGAGIVAFVGVVMVLAHGGMKRGLFREERRL
jgi:hypothetical protein